VRRRRNARAPLPQGAGDGLGLRPAELAFVAQVAAQVVGFEALAVHQDDVAHAGGSAEERRPTADAAAAEDNDAG
jgi:hypothetical protein